ncbi:capsid cement protein [Vibrio cincinnatiensis]|uniref:capsid cement protein n=1 Tax=Vibrio cincinnatiensis TaxID=675 RepID=UPI001FAAF638|nr:capsid cement protein [Vibrio cincinnatiensis]
MRYSDGKKIAVIAPAGGFKKDIPCLVGSLLVVPTQTIKAGEVVTCHIDGHFDGPIKAGDTPTFKCDAAYFEAGEFTKTKPTEKDAVAQPVGVFVDGGVLLTGAVITEFVA